jgi:DNA-binding MarR family transcriptional regulator
MDNNNILQKRSAGKIISEISRTAHVYFNSEFRDYSIGHAQVGTLLFISRNEGVSQLEISENLNLDKSSITSQLKILERNGYIFKKPNENDARKYRIYITDKTKEILFPLKLVFSNWTDTLFIGFSDKERSETFVYLERMLDNARNIINEIKDKNKE